MATRGDLIARIFSELHLEGTSYTAQVINALNSAVAFYRPERFWFTEGTTEATAATVSYLTLSSDLPSAVTIDSVRVRDDSGSWGALTRETWDQFQAHATMTSQPSSYALHGALLHVWPTNDATRTVEVTWSGRVTMSASNSSSCVWTNEAEELIRLHATCDLCENFLLDLPRADRARGREGVVLSQLVSETVRRLGIGRNMKGVL